MKKYILIIFLILVIIILAFNFGLKVNENKSDNTKQEYNTYLVYNSVESEGEGLDNVRMVFAFNDRNICTDCRMVWTFDTEEIAKENYENWKKTGLQNLKIESKEVAFNAGAQIGRTKDEIKESQLGNYERYEY